ncbi:MAG: hypothetical protein NW203_07105 [Hyphomonadaceae bacterium]|nr:hypothetical protein [Hyphomonadaceae bacterium]
MTAPQKSPPRMRLMQRRALTTGEIALARPMFGPAFDAARITLVQLPPLGFAAMAPSERLVAFSRWRAPLDFTEAALSEQGWLIHELAHCWQAQAGIALPLAKLAALGAAAYRQTPDARGFAGLNIETQAECARFAFLARAGAPDPAGARYAKLWPIAA